MKISQEIRSKVEQQPVRKTQESKQSFEQMVQIKSNQVKQQELEKLIEEISKQGERIARFRSFKDLAKFKRMISHFLKETVYNGLRIKDSRSFHMNSFSHKLTTVEKIDEKLVQLTEDMIDQEKKTVDLLGVIGEIRGLLMNVYI